jgi:hypothetical protein
MAARSRGQDRGQERGQEGDAGQRRAFESVHVYGGRGALCFSADDTRGEEQTVRLEAAPSIGAKKYDWGQKVVLQFTTRELPYLLAVLLGWLPEYRVSAHGSDNDKGASLQNQDGGKLYVTVWHGKTSRAVPVMPPDLWPVVNLVVKQMLADKPHLSAESLLSMIRLMVVRYRAAQDAGKASS